MDQRVGDQFAEGDERVGRAVVDRAVGLGDDGCVEGPPGPQQRRVEHPRDRPGDGDLVARPCLRGVARQRLGRGLDDVTGEPLLGVHAEREQARDGRLASGEGDAGPAEEFGVVGEAAESGRVAFADGGEEGVDEFGVEVVDGGVIDGRAVEQRWLARGEEALLLQVRERVVAVVAAQVGRAGRGDAAGFGGPVTLVHPSDDDRLAVRGRVVDREADRWCEGAGLRRQPLLERLWVGEPDWSEPSLFVETKNDRSTAWLVRQGTQCRGERGGQPAGGRLDLHLGGVAAGHSKFGDHSAHVADHTQM